MFLTENYCHLTYCSNVHPGELWGEHFNYLKQYLPALKASVSPDQPFGVGLRLSNQATLTLSQEKIKKAFKAWLDKEGLYVFTMNGFEYGNFKTEIIKDRMYKKDWSTKERLDYTKRMVDILVDLLPAGMEGGISTAPLSYKPWHEENEYDAKYTQCAEYLSEIGCYLVDTYQKTGKVVHVDIEPEPDCLIEKSSEALAFFKGYLVPIGVDRMIEKYNVDRTNAEQLLKNHIRLCYDVCHFALTYEKPRDILEQLNQAGIKIGKIQVTSAIKCQIPESQAARLALRKRLALFAEPIFLHQVVEQMPGGALLRHRDLPNALDLLENTQAKEWRIHYHLPLCFEKLEELTSTRNEIGEVFEVLQETRFTNNLEIEIYTFEQLPAHLKMDLKDFIVNEYRWVEKLVQQCALKEQEAIEVGIS